MQYHNLGEGENNLSITMLTVVLAAAALAAVAPDRPTVVHVIADDLGFNDLGHRCAPISGVYCSE